MSEKQLQEGIRDVIRAMDGFANADVVINDYGVFDLSSQKAPYIIIENSDDFVSTQDGYGAVTVWSPKLCLIVRFDKWKTTQDEFRDYRQALLDEFNGHGNARSAGGVEDLNIKVLRTSSPILEWYSPDLEENQQPGTFPVFLIQFFTFEAEER